MLSNPHSKAFKIRGVAYKLSVKVANTGATCGHFNEG